MVSVCGTAQSGRAGDSPLRASRGSRPCRPTARRISSRSTFALLGSTLVSAVDAKPKSTTALRRLDNIAGNPFVTVLVDGYSDDWTQLWWARGDGWARMLPVTEAPGFDALVAKYEPYAHAPADGPAIVIEIDHWSGWSAATA